MPQRAAKGVHKQGCAKPTIGRPTPTLNMGGRNAALLQPWERQVVDERSRSHAAGDCLTRRIKVDQSQAPTAPAVL